MRGKQYVGESIDVYYDVSLCVHAAECVRGLPEVFDTKRKPWILPDGAEAPDVATVIERCPSGALQFVRKDGGDAETPDVPTSIKLNDWQQIEMRGDLHIEQGDDVISTYRATLCGCGQSGKRPICDHSGACKG